MALINRAIRAPDFLIGFYSAMSSVVRLSIGAAVRSVLADESTRWPLGPHSCSTNSFCGAHS